MIQINKYKTELEETIELIKMILGIDVAIFDLQAQLVVCTKDYLLQKGNTVHAPSIEEVIAKKKVVVNKPGHMPTCSGCRFIGNCPAKIEILKSIRLDEVLFGVMTFTSFSKQGHDKITKNTKIFVDALNMFSDGIARLLSRKQLLNSLDETKNILNAFMDLSRESMLAVNPKGTVIKCNHQAQKLFSFCDLYTRSAYHILPGHVIDKALEGNHLKKIGLNINNQKAYVSAKPVFEGNEVTACVFTIHENELLKPDKKFSDHISLKSNENFSDSPLSSILGESYQIVKIKKNISKLSKSLSTVLITGETGTGKGLLAKVIHQTSVRSKGPFVPLNCTSIPETLFESELFGYEEGAFTGAKKGGKPGRLELARGGTLFLDEIGEMPLHMQVKLLNVLQDYEFQRVGGVAPISIDIRVIAATNQDLHNLVEEKKFRTDLFYRLNVIPMTLPPLRNREKDIDIIAGMFLKDANKKVGRNIQTISNPVMALFRSHTWPGNIRELQNIIEYCINLEDTDIITEDSLPERFLTHMDINKSNSQGIQFGAITKTASPPGQGIKSRVLTSEAKTILSYLDRHGHDVQGKNKTASELGISLRTLYRKLEKYSREN
ncbi:MAG: sigma 54-interacting transcriptional regulator [Desulfobacula sp.]|nr:sigma 54-interacting transcriptional regulator [Desulfobacula sp.]